MRNELESTTALSTRNVVSLGMLPDEIKHRMKAQKHAASRGRENFMCLRIVGAPGIGKSQAPAQIARSEGWYVDMVNLMNYSPVEVTGWVTQVGDAMSQLKPDWLIRVMQAVEDGKDAMIIFEEVNQCEEEVQKRFAQIIWDRKVAGVFLPANVLLVANGNRKEDKAGVKRTLGHMTSRFLTVELVAELEPTLEYFTSIGVTQPVIDYLAFYGKGEDQCLHRPQPEGPSPSARTYEQLSDTILAGATGELLRVEANGCIGIGEAAKFRKFMDIYNDMVHPKEILENPETADVPEGLDTQVALVGALAGHVEQATMEAFCTYAKRLPEELQAVAAQHIKRRNKMAEKKASETGVKSVPLSSAQLVGMLVDQHELLTES